MPEMRVGTEGVEATELITAGDTARLDVLVSHSLGVTRTFARRLIEEERVTRVNANPRSSKLKPSHKVTPGEGFTVYVPPPDTLDIEPEDVSFDVLYEDEFLLVVDKPAGLVVHPANGHWRGTLVHGLLFRYPDIGLINNVRRPGIVHRLDATTSGLMLVARTERALVSLQKDFHDRRIKKEYLALAEAREGFKQMAGVLEGPIGRHPQNRLKMAVVEGARPSATEYRVLSRYGGYALVVCNLLTGRTHQIRVHMSAFGHPLFGDTLYGARQQENFDRVFLHSWRVSFTHPITALPMCFRRCLPDDLRARLLNFNVQRDKNATIILI
ncbi:pseudouridine synthase [Synergistales bacterium]|nr:pseudouridine synthase [Synergistales bacterium]